MNPRWSEELIAQLGAEDGPTRRRARETLVAIGEPALASLVELLGRPPGSPALGGRQGSHGDPRTGRDPQLGHAPC